MRGRITKRAVDQVQSSEKEVWLWDAALRGFGLRVTPNGAKTYWVQYRMGGRGTTTKKVKIGVHGSPWTPDQARTEAETLLAKVAQGVDPAAERKETLAKAFTMSELADRYVTQHLQVKNKESTQKEFGRLVERIIKPELGSMAVVAVTRGDISALHHKLKDTPRQANLALAVLSKMFSLAEVWGFRPDFSNPCHLVERYKENARDRFLSNSEVERLGLTLAQMEADFAINESVANTVRLLLLTGCRLGEVRALRWNDVDLDTGALRIRDTKNGTPRAHPVGALAMAFLAELPRTSEWVFPAVTDAQKCLPEATVENGWKRIRERAGLDGVHIHDLRHTVGTYAGQTNANAFMVRDKLGQKTLAMTGRYVNKDADPLRELSDKIEGRIMAAMKAGADAAAGKAADQNKVVPLPTGPRRKSPGVT